MPSIVFGLLGLAVFINFFGLPRRAPVVGGLVFLVSWLDAWSDVFGWFAEQSLFTVLVGLPVAIALVAGLASYPGIRRVVP